MDEGAKRRFEEVSSPRGGKDASKVARKGSLGSVSAIYNAAPRTPTTPTYGKPGMLSSEETKIREKVKEMLTNTLSAGSSDGDRQQARAIADQVELSVFDVSVAITKEYKQKAQALKYNLTRNTDLRERVLSGAILPEDLAAMSSAEMASDDQKKKREAAAVANLAETVNNEELQKLKRAAEGIQLRKTDQGLEAIPDGGKKKAEDEEKTMRERDARDREEEKWRADREAAAAALAKTIVAVGEEDEKAYLTNFGWKSTAIDDDDNAGADGGGWGRTSSPTFDMEIGTDADADVGGTDVDEDMEAGGAAEPAEVAMPGHLVWTGTIVPQGTADPFDLDAFLLSGPGVSHPPSPPFR